MKPNIKEFIQRPHILHLSYPIQTTINLIKLFHTNTCIPDKMTSMKFHQSILHFHIGQGYKFQSNLRLMQVGMGCFSKVRSTPGSLRLSCASSRSFRALALGLFRKHTFMRKNAASGFSHSSGPQQCLLKSSVQKSTI